MITWVETIPAIAGALYLAAAAGYAWRGEWGWALTYASYGTANAGLIIAAIGGRD